MLRKLILKSQIQSKKNVSINARNTLIHLQYSVIYIIVSILNLQGGCNKTSNTKHNKYCYHIIKNMKIVLNFAIY